MRRQDHALEVILRWMADGFVDADMTVFVHLVDEAGTVVAQGDGPPMDGRWPTSLWLPGLSLDDVHRIELPEDLATGRHALVVGLYDPRTGERLLATNGKDSVTVGVVALP